MYMVSRADWQNAMKGAEVRFATGHWVWMREAIQHAEQGWRSAELEAVAVHEQLAEAARAQQGMLALLAAAQQECASMHARLQVGG